MAYQKHTWVTGEPITQERMNIIEKGIEDAYQEISYNDDDISALNTTVSTLSSDMGDVQSAIQTIRQNTSDVNTYSKEGHEAWNAVLQAATLASGTPAEGNVVFSKTLDGRFSDIETDISNMRTEIQDAHRNSNDTLDKRFDDFDSRLSGFNTAMDIINDKFASASNSSIYGGYGSVDDRLEADETKIRDLRTEVGDTHQSTALKADAEEYASFLTLDARLEEGESRIVNLQNEISAAHESTRLSKTGNNAYASLDARFEAIEEELTSQNSMSSRLDTIEGNINSLSDNKINKTDIANNLTTETAGKVLDATQGKLLKDTIDNMDTAYKAADNALDGRLDAIDGGSALDTTNGTLAARVSALETEVDMTSTDSRIDTALSRIEAMDNSSTGSIAGLDTRISALETTVDTSTTGLSDRMTEAENAISHAASGADAGGLTERLTVVETSITGNGGIEDRLDAIDDASTGAIKGLQDADLALDGRLDAIDGGSALDTTNGTLSARVTALEGKDTIIIDYDGEHSNYTSDEPNLNNPSVNADYLIADDNGKYFYWRYFGAEDGWQLVGGAGGSGNGSSSGMFIASLDVFSGEDALTPDPNIDYFVGNNTIGYTHYRYIPSESVGESGTFVKILPKGLLANASVNNNGKPVITTLEDSSTNLFNSFNALKTVDCVTTFDTDGVTPKSYALSFTDVNGQEYAWELAAGGGGSSYSVQFINDTVDSELYIPNDATSAALSVHILAKQGQTNLSQTSTITVKYKLESASEYTIARVISGVANNVVTSVDIIDLLQKDSITNIQLTASIQPEDTPITRNLTYTIHRVPMSIEAYNYNPASVKTSSFNFQYYCIGSNLSKVVHFVIDNQETTEDVGIPANTDLLTKRINVSSLTRGMHSLKVYFTVGSYSSNEINTYFLYDDGTEENKPIIALATDKSTIQDGDALNLNYTVYTKGLEKTEEVTLQTYTIIDNVSTTYETKTYQAVDNGILNNVAIINYPSSGTFYITMTAKHTVNNVEYTDSKTISIIITEYQSAYDSQMVRLGSANLIYEYDAYGRTNNDSDKENYQYEYTSVSGTTQTFSGTNTGFNWASNGYTNGESLLISGGAVHSVNIPLFVSNTGTVSLETDTQIDDILQNGRTFAIDYEVNSATDLNAIIASFGNGLKITPSVSYLVPQTTTVTVNSHGLIEKEDEICAAYLATGKRMHMVFVLEPKATEPTSQGEYHQCVNIYINGEFVNSCPYALSDNFSTNSTFTIGSNTCLINLYSIRMYNRGLTNDEVLRNYMMAPSTKRSKINRFAENDVLNDQKLVDYNKARNKFNCLLITGTIAPYKMDTKTPSGVTLTKPDFENDTYTTEFNLLDKKSNGTYYSSNNVQGTSSQTYPIHNLKVYLAEEEIDDITGDPVSKKYKYSLKGSAGIAESTLCWKADYMSTDHANTFNANFANDLFTDKLPSQIADPKVQNTVYGIRCLLFQRSDENSTPVFIADGCLNNDKGNNSAFGLSIKNESLSDTTRQKWEFTNNSSALDFFQADGLLATSNNDYYAKTAFESTFPDEGDLEDEGLQPNYNHLQIMMTWVHQRANFWDASDTPTGTVSYNENTGEYTTTGTVYTYNDIPYSNMRDYKKAIFRNEFTQHFNLNHILTYHLFSEFIALCDNRAKNMFMRCDNVRDEVVKDMSGNTIFSGNNNANATFFTNTTNIGTSEDPIYALANADQIDWQTGEQHSNFAIWYPVLYDLDSCYGAENVGRITIAYDADWNYIYNNKKQFSGVESRLWLMVEEAFDTELKALAQTLYPNKLNYNTFYTTQVQAMLDSTCPAVINQDMLLKFNAYWADGFIDYSLPNNPHVYRDYKYIQRGSRAYQKDTFIKLRSNYLSSKYVTSNFMNDQIRFRSSVIVPVSNSGITLTTNQTLYPAITYGDNKAAIRSVNKIGPGQSVTLQASDQVGNTDTIHIGGASALTDIGDISKFEPYNLDVSGGINLKSLVVGSNVVNASTNKIDGLGSCALLETLNVRNCTNFSGTLNLSGNGLIKNVYAGGSGITNIELREGGNLTNIEYGAQTQTIKIINHRGLQNFTFENAENNHYASVTRLHIENTPNVPVVDIINNAMSHLTAGIRLVGLNIDLFEDAVTEEEIDAALSKTNTFLNTLVSDFAHGKYINSSGVYIANSTEYPYISGTIHTTSIRSSLLTKLHELYPELTIDADVEEHEFEVQYWNYDGTLLYTDHGTNEDNIKDPVSDTNPITGVPYIEMPTKPQDAQYKYKFGLYNNQNEYRRFTGWVKRGTSTNPVTNEKINSDLILVAVYPTLEDQYYTVAWYYEQNGTKITERTVKYGTDLSSDASPLAQNQKIRSGGNSIKVFKGWSRPLGKITQNINIYGLWEESTINESTENIIMEDLSAADIYAISRLTSTRKAEILADKLGSPIMVPMGLQFDYTDGVNITNLLGNEDRLVLDGTTDTVHIYNNIKPLLTNSDWTFAIDYKFLMDSAISFTGTEYVLASCYQEANSAIIGFKISLMHSNTNVHAIQVSWGTQSVIVDYATVDDDGTWTFNSYRNVVVLNHNSDRPNFLGVSYRVPNISNNSAPYGANYSLELGYTELEWANNTSINTPLIIGGNYAGATTEIENLDITRQIAQGIIYWAKYWDVDLGAQNCVDLAAWPHETVPFYLTGYNGASTRDTEQIYTNSALSFAAAQGMGDRFFYAGSTGTLDDNGYFGWHQSTMRDICTNLIYVGLPEAYRSIISSQEVRSIKRVCADGMTQTNAYEVTNDHIFLGARREIDETMGTTNSDVRLEVNSNWLGPWGWFASPRTIYQVTGSISSRVEARTSTNDNYYLYRFPGAYISDTTRIFRTSTRPTQINGLQIMSGGIGTPVTIVSGDVWVNDSNVAYIYLSENDIENGEYVDIKEASGGWRQAVEWALRTFNPGANSGYEWCFMRVTAAGAIITQPVNSSSRNTPRLLCPEFTV